MTLKLIQYHGLIEDAEQGFRSGGYEILVPISLLQVPVLSSLEVKERPELHDPCLPCDSAAC